MIAPKSKYYYLHFGDGKVETQGIKSLAQEYKAQSWQSWDLNSGSLAPEPMHLTITAHSACKPRHHQILQEQTPV